MKILNKLIKILKNPTYLFVLISFFVLLMGLLSYIQNFKSVHSILSYNLPILQKLSLVVSILFNLYTENFSLAENVMYVLLAGLIALQLTLTMYYFNTRRKLLGTRGLTISTLFVLLGAGCASCGTALLGSLVSTSLVSVLPLFGKEFVLLALVVSVFGVRSILNKILAPIIC